MAQQTTVTVTDDLDGREGAEPVEFGLDGVDYTIDLVSENAEALRDALAAYVAAATVKPKGRDRDKGKGRNRDRKRGEGDRDRMGAIRQWAREQGMEVSERGRLSSEVKDAYYAAHPDEQTDAA